jgi:beta-glucosidase-like glycosyl hydrolase
VNAGVAAVMTAHVRYPALDPDAPATFSRPLVDLLRGELGFEGLVVTDAMIMEGARVGRTEGDGAVAALVSGVDLLLYPQDVGAVHAALVAALDGGRLPRARAAEALARYERALAAARAPVADPVAGPYADAPALADALLGTDTLRASSPVLTGPLELLVVDDDVGGPYPASPSDHVAQALERGGVALGPGGSRVVLAFNEPRAWKGRAGFGAHTAAQLAELAPGASLVVLFGHPRLVEEVPGRAPVLVAWHRQRLMQEAVGRWIVGRVAAG